MATLTLRDVDDAFILQLKEFTGEGTASKAIISAAALAIELSGKLQAERVRSKKWEMEWERLQILIDTLVPAMKQALELAGQGDLFNQEGTE